LRYAAGHKEQTRKRIVAAAARRFRRQGYRGAGVDDLMKEAGLTAGGFYAHFGSKRELLEETLGLSLRQLRELLLAGLDDARGPELMRAVVGRYLSRSHRDSPSDGCSLP
jgi:TetR/AcrR family transcriptional repressor of nem operon